VNSVDRIAILGGTGRQGRGLAKRFALAGFEVVVGSREPQRARADVAGWQAAAGVEVATNPEAAAAAGIVVLTVPFAGVDAVIDEIRPHIRAGSLLVDVTVPLEFTGKTFRMVEVAEGSAAEHVRAGLPESVAVAGAFKTLPAHVLEDAAQPLACDEFVCGDSDEARARASALVAKLPRLRPIDVGPLSRSRFIEHATALLIAVNRRHKIREGRFQIVGLP
jgi:NADPH-dependent F420 reductase